jgi:hypothetical protein
LIRCALEHFLSAGVDYEYKAVNLLKGEQSDPGGFVLDHTITCSTTYLMLQLLEYGLMEY